MTKYRLEFEEDLADENGIFDTYQQALDAVSEVENNMRVGAEVLHMSNPGDYSYDEDDDFSVEVEITEVDD